MDKFYSDIEILAYHESGHVVLNFVNGISFDYVTIISDGDSDGKVKGYWKYPDENDEEYELTPENIKTVRKHVMVSYGGMISEKKLTGTIQCDHVYDGDRMAIYMWANLISSGPDHQQYLYDSLRKEAEEVFTNENGEDTVYWQCVKSIAAILLERKTLSFDEAKVIYDEIIFSHNNLT